MKKQIEKKVYKANSKALKRIFIVMIIILIIAILSVPIKSVVEYLYLSDSEWHEVDNYNIKFKLPRAYVELKNDKENKNIPSVVSKETTVKINEKYNNVAPEVVYSGGNSLNGISIMVQCLATEKTKRTLDDIADSQHALVRIYYEDDYKISEPIKKYVNVLDTSAIMTTTTLTSKDETKTMINYLVPMEDKEVTITFLMKHDNLEKKMKEIERIVTEFREIKK